MNTNSLVIKYGERAVSCLNPDLVERMNLDQKRIDALVASHVERLRLFEEMNEAPVRSLLRLAKQFDGLEFHQQGLWGFALDRDHHCWWSVPRCSCPRTDNAMLRGIPIRVVNTQCLVHGSLVCDEPADCAMCPQRMPVGDGEGSIMEWTDIPAGHRVVNVDCPEHGTPLVLFQPLDKR